ncbi:MAG TPA: DUF4350 domain-containing protein [Pyrinomonadaceae bacterium]|jgi:hypothetical protein|nr:DUF4350 domain-containing protein [Pyrinomonadaceae bacterium]
MRQRFAVIIIIIGFVVLLLVALNAASYVEVERKPDSEYDPDRSTYNSGATGTRALYDFLRETGRDVTRWREAPTALLKHDSGRPSTLVVLEVKLSFQPEEVDSLMQWVREGGRLVVIDRRPNPRLLPPSGDWRIMTELKQFPSPDVHADNPEEMTAGVSPARPTQPTSLTNQVESVMPSRFAGLVHIWLPDDKKVEPSSNKQDPQQEAVGEPVTVASSEDEAPEDESISEEPSPPPAPQPKSAPTPVNAALQSPAPVSHLADYRGVLLADYPHGAGRIIILSDPFIVANAGLNRADNLQLARNIIAGAGGLIAFDEYHQGHPVTRNEMLAYFEGTPVLAAVGQATLIVLLLLWTKGRRFARPLPLATIDRRSSLEFVASMAELQQRARAFDLAVENIYTRTRRVLVRYAGVEHNTPRAEVAARVAARSAVDRLQLEALMRECEDAINGERINARRTLELVRRLRELERTLGLRMRAREIKQAKEM